MKTILITAIMTITAFCGCIVIKDKNSDSNNIDTSKILVANPNNVYKNATNIIIKALVQDKNGKWVEADAPVLIPVNYYIGSGIGIE